MVAEEAPVPKPRAKPRIDTSRAPQFNNAQRGRDAFKALEEAKAQHEEEQARRREEARSRVTRAAAPKLNNRAAAKAAVRAARGKIGDQPENTNKLRAGGKISAAAALGMPEVSAAQRAGSKFLKLHGRRRGRNRGKNQEKVREEREKIRLRRQLQRMNVMRETPASRTIRALVDTAVDELTAAQSLLLPDNFEQVNQSEFAFGLRTVAFVNLSKGLFIRQADGSFLMLNEFIDMYGEELMTKYTPVRDDLLSQLGLDGIDVGDGEQEVY